MKHIFLFLVVSSLFTTLVFAEETTTECDQMREDTLRSNPKATVTAQTTTKDKSSQGNAQ